MVDVHVTTLPKGSGTVVCRALIVVSRWIGYEASDAEVSAGEG